MAKEIVIQCSMLVRNGAYQYQFTPGQMQIDQQSVGGGTPGMVAVGSTPEALDFGDVLPGWCVFQNLDAEHYVDVGPVVDSTLAPAWRLYPGEHVPIRLIPGVEYGVVAPDSVTEPVRLLVQAQNR